MFSLPPSLSSSGDGRIKAGGGRGDASPTEKGYGGGGGGEVEEGSVRREQVAGGEEGTTNQLIEGKCFLQLTFRHTHRHTYILC